MRPPNPRSDKHGSYADDGSRFIELANGRLCRVDAEDFDYLNNWWWSEHKRPAGLSYAIRAAVHGQTKMHRLILEARGLIGPRDLIDHCNGDGLDNRKQNLRKATHAQNMRNRKLPEHNTTGFYGLMRSPTEGKWLVRIREGGKSFYYGTYSDQIEAACAYNVAAVKHFGEYARLNRMD